MSVTLDLDNGLRVHVTARAAGCGFRVELVAERSHVTDTFDERFQRELADYEAAASVGAHRDLEFPGTGAEVMLEDVELLRLDGCPPFGVIRSSGGSATPWLITWTSHDWQPERVLLVGLGRDGVILEIARA